MSIETSVIIISYNNFDTTTGPCLASLMNGNVSERNEILIVENNSTDCSPLRLREVVKNNPAVKAIFNRSNRGFAGGNNDGVKAASGDLLVLLNSDTIVPPGAIEKLTEVYSALEGNVMLGPVTNSAGNEQEIFCMSDTPEEIFEEGKRFCFHGRGSVFSTESLGFFCVAIPRGVYSILDGLDELFGLGYYEDTDFCVRARNNGVRMFFSEEIFVYHKGSVSFSRQREQSKKIMKSNKKRFFVKHPHVILKHPRKKNLDIMKRYLTSEHVLLGTDKVSYRFDNRMKQAKKLFFRNPLKKIVYALQLMLLQHKARNLFLHSD